jgi:HPt (histidine-containing phosphotransfer) domain-containing protein
MNPDGSGARSPLDASVLEGLREILGAAGGRGLADLFDVYRSSANELMQDLAGGVEAQDARTIEHCAHALKSSSRNIGANALGSLFEALENLARGGTLGRAKDVFSEASAEFARVLEALEREA